MKSIILLAAVTLIPFSASATVDTVCYAKNNHVKIIIKSSCETAVDPDSFDHAHVKRDNQGSRILLFQDNKLIANLKATCSGPTKFDYEYYTSFETEIGVFIEHWSGVLVRSEILDNSNTMFRKIGWIQNCKPYTGSKR